MKESFVIKNADHVPGLYFPLVSETGLKSCVTPNLGGDAKLDQNHFLLEPRSIEDLRNNRSTRNFWLDWGEDTWSITGVSAWNEALWDRCDETMEVETGILWHKVTRRNPSMGVEGEILSFVPYDQNYEVHQITIRNTKETAETMRFYTAIPMYGRSADNLRDHRHVTSLLNRMEVTPYGIHNTPTLSFDERGHQPGDSVYYVEAVSAEGELPQDACGVLEDFVGNSTLLRPEAIFSGRDDIWQTSGSHVDGQEVIGALRFHPVEISPGEEKSYIVVIGIAPQEATIASLRLLWDSAAAVEAALEATITHWSNLAPIRIHTGDPDFDFFFMWVGFQPELRRLFGCSFLPHHDYGRGGRGWRDLWQDCLALLIMHPQEVRELLPTSPACARTVPTPPSLEMD